MLVPLHAPQFHPRPGVCVCWGMGGWAGGQEGGTALSSIRAPGAASATAPNPQAATAFQINSLSLSVSPSLPPARVLPLRSLLVHPLTPSMSLTHLPSPVRLTLLSLFLTLPLTLSHSLPLFLKSFCFSHMPVLSLTGSFSLFPPLFLRAFGLFPQPCQELAPPPSNLPVPINLA